jgi:hypothetical protein
MGILDPDCISEKWLAPIGRKLVINKEITGINPPDTIDAFTDLIISLKERIGGKFPPSSDNAFDAEKHQINVETWFIPWFAQDNKLHLNPAPAKPSETKTLTLPGTKAEINASIFEPDKVMLMKYKVYLDKKQRVKVMFNTHDNSRVWIDGEYAFGREGGRMAPSFHRVPPNQQKELDLDAGEHEILVGIAPSSGKEKIEWVIGVGDAKTDQWLKKAFV